LNTPSPNGQNGRGSNGRFAKGNAGGPGNPHAVQVARLRTALLQAVTPEDVVDVIQALLAQAKAGDVASIRELLQRLLGLPVEIDLLERTAALETAVEAVNNRA
jgi:hypothetical protein